MKSIWFFIKTTIKGGIFFLLPFVFIVIITEKIISTASTIVTPFATKFGIDHFAGKATIAILIFMVVLSICFFCGLVTKIKLFKSLNTRIDELLLKNFPAYQDFKLKNKGAE